MPRSVTAGTGHRGDRPYPSAVTGAPLRERSDRLPPEPASAGRARRLVSETLREWDRLDLIEPAALLVSELVTNSVLHAGTDIEVRILPAGGGARVEVADGSATAPSRRRFADEAVTGRGLEIVGAVATAWGVESTATGKVVWFQLGTGGTAPGDHGRGSGAFHEARFAVRLLQLPVALVAATLEHGDAMLRELALMSFGDGLDAAAPRPRLMPDLDLGNLIEALEQARRQGRPSPDIDVIFPAQAVQAAVDRLALVDEADRLAEEGRLLLPPALPEIGRCRRWLLGQIAVQGRGEVPTAWRLPEPADSGRRAVGLDPEEVAALGPDPSSSIVADEHNRIVFAGPVVAELLGWDAEDLTGRRLTTIVPSHLREPHLVGYTRYQVTGESSLLGQPVALPALRSDGSIVDVELVIRALPGGRGRRLYRATITEKVP